MRIIKRIAVFPLIIVLWLARVIVDLIVRIECWVAGVGFLLLAILSFLAIIRKQWIQLEILGIITILCIGMIAMSAYIVIYIDDLRDLLKIQMSNKEHRFRLWK